MVCRYSDLIPRFGQPVSALSLIINQVIDYIFANLAHHLIQWNNNIPNPLALQNCISNFAERGNLEQLFQIY